MFSMKIHIPFNTCFNNKKKSLHNTILSQFIMNYVELLWEVSLEQTLLLTVVEQEYLLDFLIEELYQDSQTLKRNSFHPSLLIGHPF